ncbi:hypothetical protein BV25DRAFT_1830699 [Artomyces pyxidatus]|uniref:Uncharacterized protein n=1 Tax=Artomyces pyxidatus TaxID=48021 RepID=A0ACB8SN04_9AGAM|nr:hypothetical protein BV25DRAFT_1830699 [Artomyces pyxidatus]
MLRSFAYKSSRSALRHTTHSAKTSHLEPIIVKITTVRMISTPPAAASSQIVTLPFIPELYDVNYLDALLPPKTETSAVLEPEIRNAMMDALKATAHQVYTTNMAPAFDSTLSPTLDAFQRLVPYANSADIHAALTKSWDEDPNLTLRLIWNTRSIHDGKGEKELFYKAWSWLYEHHPRTAIANLAQLVVPNCKVRGKKSLTSHGYWKDLLNIVALVMLDQLGHNAPGDLPFLHTPREMRAQAWIKLKYIEEASKLGIDPAPADREAASKRATESVKAIARTRRMDRAGQVHDLLGKKLADPRFRALYITVARLLTDQLVREACLLEQAEALPDGPQRKRLLNRLSLVSKWAPTPGCSHDRVTNIATAVSLLLRRAGLMDSLPLPVDLAGPVPAPLTHVLRSFYQRWVLTPLRAATYLPEPLMSAKRWSSIEYKRVPSMCMNNNNERFFKHDPERFAQYIMDVESGKTTISGATLMPHELVRKAVLAQSSLQATGGTALEVLRRQAQRKLMEMQMQVLEAQWATLIARLRAAGTLDNSIAICDVSGSMGYIGGDATDPIHPAIALSYILAQVARPPFANTFITFSAHPEVVVLDPARGLGENVRKMAKSSWSMNTDLHAVFMDLLLPLAKAHNVPQEDMIKRLFVFSDMQFDSATAPSYGGKVLESWETNHDAIEHAYHEAGYEMPEIVYWDLSNEFMTTAVQAERKGVALMNGFSPAMLKVFMGEEPEEEVEVVEVVEGEVRTKTARLAEDFTPLNVMKRALGRVSYDGLVVVD